ncbi:MAG: hypothetical protein ACRDPY_42900 [Streptosporangiaceae bacterium]
MLLIRVVVILRCLPAVFLLGALAPLDLSGTVSRESADLRDDDRIEQFGYGPMAG